MKCNRLSFKNIDSHVYIECMQSKFILIEDGLEINQRAWSKEAEAILTPRARSIIAFLHRAFESNRRELLRTRAERQREYDAGLLPKYLDSKSQAASGAWKVAPIPADLLCRRVEITGPVDSTKMVINMLSRNSEGARADCAMLDFEDSLKPAWINVINGLHNVIGAAAGNLSFKDKAASKEYRLNPEDMAVLMVRCRGLHLNESNLKIDGAPISAGIFDLALSFLHTADLLVAKDKTPKYYIPKCEDYLEARWWNDLFVALQEKIGLPKGTLRATFLIETLPAAFQIEEILFEIREHAAGLNVGRWDKIFSDIKTLKNHSDRIMADRSSINMQRSWMANYAERLIKICHARGAFAMGGMSAFTPGKSAELRQAQTKKVFEDKQNEANIGHDGCWVSHPYFIAHAMSAFKNKNQLNVAGRLQDKYPDILPQGIGPRTEQGLRTNVRVGIAYMHGWMQEVGCIAWDNLMEDLATLEISRAQVWQWWKHAVTLDNGQSVTTAFIKRVFDEELKQILNELEEGDTAKWSAAKERAAEIFLSDPFPEFLSTQSELA